MHARNQQTGSLIVHTLFRLSREEAYLSAAAGSACDDTGCACHRGDPAVVCKSLVTGSG
jgi:hypothetical protein